MQTNLNNFSDRLKYFIEFKGFKNTNEFGKFLGYSSSEKIFRLLRDNNNKPSYDFLQDLSNKFEGVVEWLITGNGTISEIPEIIDHPQTVTISLKPGERGISGIEHIEEFKENETIPKSIPNSIPNSDFKVLAITVDDYNNENIEIVPVRAAASYAENLQDPVFIQQLDRFRLPVPEFATGTYRAFELEGLSMYPTFQAQELVISKFVADWISGIKDYQPYVVVTHNGIMIKRLINQLGSNQQVKCISDNVEFKSFNLKYHEIQQIWQVRGSLRFAQHLADGRAVDYQNQFYREFEQYRQKVDYLYERFNGNQNEFE